MFNRLFIIVFLIFVFISSCSKNEVKVEKVIDTDINEQMSIAYIEGLEALDKGDGINAAKKFSEAELLFPQSIWAPRASLMTAYSYYSNSYYQDTIVEIERYLKTYPLHNRKNYAYYLLALSYYEQIVDEKKDLGPIVKAKTYFNLIIKEYPNSEFAVDASYKLDLINDFLASKEMYLGRYYSDKEKWIPAINRFKTVIKDYETTIFIEEALHRLVEIHYKLGLENEALNYAKLLGYNYQSGDWYAQSYKIFNKNYKKPELEKIKNKKSIIDRFKSLIN